MSKKNRAKARREEKKAAQALRIPPPIVEPTAQPVQSPIVQPTKSPSAQPIVQPTVSPPLTLPNEKSIIRTITDESDRFIVGMRLVDESRNLIQLVLLKPPCIKEVLTRLSPEELLAARDFIGRVALALSQRGFQITQ